MHIAHTSVELPSFHIELWRVASPSSQTDRQTEFDVKTKFRPIQKFDTCLHCLHCAVMSSKTW